MLSLKCVLLRTWVNFDDISSEGRCGGLRWTELPLQEMGPESRRPAHWHHWKPILIGNEHFDVIPPCGSFWKVLSCSAFGEK